jgi:Mycotoxin biosynthesis protein UstYa
MHCLNYLRRTLMCNVDLVLGTTTTYEDYGIHGIETHLCRDYDAVVRWVEANKWKGFLEYHRSHGDPNVERDGIVRGSH